MSTRDDKLKAIEAAIPCIPDFPKQGIMFRDIFGIFKCPKVTNDLLDELQSAALQISSGKKCDAVLGLEARGFLLGPALALRLNCAFVPLRKAGKLPGSCRSITYDLEYGSATFEIQESAIKPGQNVILLDDVLATGGSLRASADLVKQCGGNVLGAVVILELAELNGAEKLTEINVPTVSLLKN